MSLRRRDFIRLSAIAAGSVFARGAGAGERRNGMPYRTLGKTGEKVSLLCLGGHHIGVGSLTEQESVRLMRHAVDEGVNFFDNAWQYHGGRSEERMGLALKDGYRDKVFLMTKHFGWDPETAREQLEDSLRRLQVDFIDLWQFHAISRPDEPARIYESGVLDYAMKVRDEGKVRYIGFTGHTDHSLHAEMIDRGYDWDTVQMPLNVFDHHYRSFEESIIPKALAKSIGIIGMKSLGGSPGTIPNESNAATPAECLRYTMSLPVATVCSGMDSMDLLEQNIETAKAFTPLTVEERIALLANTANYAAGGRFEPYKRHG